MKVTDRKWEIKKMEGVKSYRRKVTASTSLRKSYNRRKVLSGRSTDKKEIKEV